MANYQSSFTGPQIDERLTAVPDKVDKVAGKGLSTNDYTDVDKAAVQTISGKADKVSSPVANNFAGLNADGSLKDSGSKASDFESAGAAASAVGAHNSSDSAHATKFAAVNTRIDNISAVGRFLAGWMSNLGLPLTNPTTMPYSYRSGDYYLVDRVVDTEWPVLHGSYEEYILYPNRGTKTIDGTKYKLYTLYEPEAGAYIRIDTYYWELDEQETQPGVGDTLVSSMEETFTVTSTSVAKNYKPNGSTYNGTASTTEETAEVKVNDMYVYDGTQWMLLHTAADVVMFGNVGGSPYDNGELNGALEQKVTIPDAFEPGNFATMSEEGVLEDSGKSASDFATAAQGALAASAYQKPASGIPEGDLASAVAAKLNDNDVFTATYGTTTYAQVAAARTAGKEVIVAYSGKVYRLYFLDGSTCYFSALFGFTSLMMYLSSTNAWWADNGTLAERTAQVAVADSVAAQELAPNTLYVFASRTSDLALSFGTAVSGEECEYKFKIPIGATLPTISGLSGVTWASGAAPSWAVNKTYEVSIVNGVGVFIEY